MKNYEDLRADGVFIACRERIAQTGAFEEHHLQTLRVASRLQRAGVVRYVLLSGGGPRWHRDADIALPGEAEGSADYMTEELGCDPKSLLQDPNAFNSATNFLCTAEDILDPINDPDHPKHDDFPEG